MSKNKNKKNPFIFDVMWSSKVENDEKLLDQYVHLLSGLGNIPTLELCPIKEYQDIYLNDGTHYKNILDWINISWANLHTSLDCCLSSIVKVILMALYDKGGQAWIGKYILRSARDIIDSVEVHDLKEWGKLQKVRILLYILDNRCSVIQYRPVGESGETEGSV